MSKRPVSLTVHKNTVESRRKRTLARDLQTGVENLVRERDIRAYAIVGIAADGRAYALWDTGAIMPKWAFPATISAVLQRDMESHDVEEDWRPALNPKGSR